MALAEEEAKYRRELLSKGLDPTLPLPSHFLNDETSGAGTGSYSGKVGKANKIFDIVDVEGDFKNAIRKAGNNPTLELTSLQKNLEVKSAEYDLTYYIALEPDITWEG